MLIVQKAHVFASNIEMRVMMGALVQMLLSSLLVISFLFPRTAARNSPTLVISRDTCEFTQERSRSAVETATRLSRILQPAKPMKRRTGESLVLLRDMNLAAELLLNCFLPVPQPTEAILLLYLWEELPSDQPAQLAPQTTHR